MIAVGACGVGGCDKGTSSASGSGGGAGRAAGGGGGLSSNGGGGAGAGDSAGASGLGGGNGGVSATGGGGGTSATGGGGGSNDQGGVSGGGVGGATGPGGQGGDACLLTGPFGPPGCLEVSGAPLGVASHPNEGANHVVICSTACYGTNPPSSGNHYPEWPVYKTYAAPVPWGFLVHGLEHGAIIVSYNCPCGCADEVAAAQAWIDALPMDDVCGTPPRVVLAPDPTLDVHWAASAWTWTLRAQTFDPAAFQAFFTDHYDHGSEVVCSGAADGSATGWCQ